MIKIGKYNRLKVTKEVPYGVFLDGGEWGEILLRTRLVPSGTKVDELLKVFVHFDSDDKIAATTVHPLATVGDCAFLKVVDVNLVGAFLDWGLEKDLLVPGPEQYRVMEKDKSYIVYLTQDSKGRIIASSKLDYFLDKSPITFKEGDEVKVLIHQTTDLGNKVIINNKHWGLIHTSEIFQRLSYGQRLTGYIKTIREDGKVDVVLRKLGHSGIHQLTARILTELQNKGGFLPLHDKSSPNEIQHAFGESKKSFKHAIGQLYKQGAIKIEESGIRLVVKNI